MEYSQVKTPTKLNSCCQEVAKGLQHNPIRRFLHIKESHAATHAVYQDFSLDRILLIAPPSEACLPGTLRTGPTRLDTFSTAHNAAYTVS